MATAPAGSGLDPRLSAGSSLPVEMPFRIESGALTVEAGLGAGLPFRAVLDTGIGDSLISTRIASDRGLSGSGEVMIASPFGPIRAAPAGPQSIRLGRVVIDSVPLCIADLADQLSGGTGGSAGASPSLGGSAGASPSRGGSAGASPSLGGSAGASPSLGGSAGASPSLGGSEGVPASRAPRPDAWIGNAVLSLCSVEVDPANKRVLLAPPDAPPMRGGAPIPMEIVNGRIEIRARANGSSEYKAIVTTGVRGCLLPASLVRSLKLTVTAERTVSMPGGSAIRVGHALLKEFRLGSAKVTNVPVLAALDDIPGFAAGTGIIGTDALMRFRMQISYARRQAVFVAAPSPKPERQPQPERPKVQPKPGLSMPKRHPQAV